MTVTDPDDPRTIRVEILVRIPSGDVLTKKLAAEPGWRQSLDMSLREYVDAILQRATAEAHRWVAAHLPTEDRSNQEEI